MDYTHHYHSPLGGITLAADGEALTGFWFDGQKHFAGVPEGAREDNSLPVFAEADRWLDLYFSGKLTGYAGGLERKAKLLEMERRIMNGAEFHRPAFSKCDILEH